MKLLNVITNPLTICNLIIIGSLVLIETFHIGYHNRGLTQCDESVIIEE